MRVNRKKVKAILFETVAIVLSIGGAACGNLEKKPEKAENNTENVILSTEEIDSTLAETLSENAEWNLLEHIESNNVMVQGRIETEDYPYGYNVGTIEDDEVGKAILLTPGTSISISGTFTNADCLNMEYMIHPWVVENSDGVIFSMNITMDGETQNYSYEVSEGTETQQISFEEYKNKEVEINLQLTNKDGASDTCDWLVLKEFSLGKEAKEVAAFGSDGYVKSATYFADEWPINFWNSEMDSLESDMEQIRKDGFDSIILVIPWREFQPEVNPISYNDYAFEKLDEVMRAAEAAELDVYVRIGYTWDFYRDESEDIVNRFCNLMGDSATQEAWIDYAGKMYETLKEYSAFEEGFLTWEDFWNTLGVCDEILESSRKDKAAFIGYQTWIEQNYTLDEYNEKYGTKYKEFAAIPVPKRDEPAMEAMYAFYDAFLNKTLEQTQEVFPNISMEVRMDWDVIYKKDGNMDYYKHTNTFLCMNSDYTATMYGIPMGFENNGERVSYTEAMEKTEYILKQLKLQNGNKPVYIEQFIFADNTPKFVNNAQIKEEELNDYLGNVSEILLENSEGYGIWTYRNYRANMLYNSQFALEDNGWKVKGEPEFLEVDDSMVCHLEDGEAIEQEISKVRNHFDADEYTLEVDIIEVNKAGTLTVKVGSKKQKVEVTEAGTVSLKFPKSLSFDIEINAQNCEVSIDNVRLYSQIQQGFLYDENNNEIMCIEGIRVLNENLR